MTSPQLAAAALLVARNMPIQGDLATQALDKAVATFSVMEDFERDLCLAGIHTGSIFHPSNCPEREENHACTD